MSDKQVFEYSGLWRVVNPNLTPEVERVRDNAIMNYFASVAERTNGPIWIDVTAIRSMWDHAHECGLACAGAKEKPVTKASRKKKAK